MTADAAGRVRAAFQHNFDRGLEVGAAVAVWQDGREVLNEWQGWRNGDRTVPWTRDTIVLFWSATKGLSSACVLHALDRAGLDLSSRVGDFWPEFAQAGKERITLSQVLSHRAGLSALKERTAPFLDHEAVIRAIEKQAPLWPPGDGHGYGPRTYGFLADEIVRRITGKTLGVYWRAEIAEPMALDLWIGLPEAGHGRVAQILAARSLDAVEDGFARAMAVPGSLTREAFTSPMSALSPSAMNTAAMRSGSFPSLGGIGSAESLAKFYAMLAGDGTWGEKRYFSSRALAWMSTPLTQGVDKTLCTETSFSAGFMTDPILAGKKVRTLYGPSLSAFGHPGAGGSLAFADPENRIGFAYVMNQMEAGVLPRERALRLVEALYKNQ